MNSVYTYSPEYVDLVIGGYKVIGWNTISVQRNSRMFTTVNGIRGKNTRTKNTDTSATISISITRTSPVNSVFSEVVRQDELYCTGRLQILLRDRLGTSVVSSSEAYLDGYADDSFTSELNDRVWTINCLSTDTWNIGGSEQSQESLFQTIRNTAQDLFS